MTPACCEYGLIFIVHQRPPPSQTLCHMFRRVRNTPAQETATSCVMPPSKSQRPVAQSSSQGLQAAKPALSVTNPQANKYNDTTHTPQAFREKSQRRNCSAPLASVEALDLSSDTQHPGTIYARALLDKCWGYPLWHPEARSGLPLSYRQEGVRIGDVGLITADGQFDFLFNVCLPANDEVNGGSVPENYQPLDLNMAGPETCTKSKLNPQAYSTAKATVSSSPGSPQFNFQCMPPQGAAFALPEGAIQQDLSHTDGMLAYASLNAHEWYIYANTIRGRHAPNGSIHLVTGFHKTNCWGGATWIDVAQNSQFTLTFAKQDQSSESHEQLYTWKGSSVADTRQTQPAGEQDPSMSSQANQCIFLRGLTITLSERVWKSIFGAKDILSLAAQRISSLYHGSALARFRQSALKHLCLSICLCRVHSKGKRRSDTINVQNVRFKFLSPLRNPDIHPAYQLNLCLLKKFPKADVAITHDNVWCSGLRENTWENIISTSEKAKNLLEDINARYQPVFQHGHRLATFQKLDETLPQRKGENH